MIVRKCKCKWQLYLLTRGSSCQLSIGQRERDEEKWERGGRGVRKQERYHLDFKYFFWVQQKDTFRKYT